MPLLLRQTKGSALTHTEMDGNLTYLESLAPSPSSVSPTYVPFRGTTGDQNSSMYYKGGNPNKLVLSNVPSYANDSQAATGGLTAGEIYRTNGTAPAPLNVAGILMIKL